MIQSWQAGNLYLEFSRKGQIKTRVCPEEAVPPLWPLEQFILVRKANAVSDPVILYKFEVAHYSDLNICYRVTGDEDNWYADLNIYNSGTGLHFKINIEGDSPVWLAEWQISGLDFSEILVPALGGRSIKATMPEGSSECYKYPFWWNAQFIVGMIDKSGIVLRSEDKKTNLKLIRITKENQSFSLSYGFEAKAPLKKKSLEFEWFMEGFNGNWKVVVDRYANWLEKNHNIPLFNEKINLVNWIDDINFVLEIWGAHRQSVKPAHSFEEIIERIEQFATLYNASETLLYLPGFAENGIDSNAPDYNPSPQCGGPVKFKKLVGRAHELGYKVMIHTNVLALTYSHPLYEKLKKHTVIDAFERPQGWGMDIDGDWLGEPYFAYMNPATEAWSELIIEKLGALIREYALDAVFLDQTLLAFNVSNGPDFMNGMVNHIQRLQKAFPDVLFAGEGIAEHTATVLPVAQIHGIDSLPGVHGADDQKHWVTAHPILSYLFRRYTKLTAHLLTRHPSHQDFERQESIYETLEILPALSIYNRKQTIDSPELQKMLQRSKKFTVKKIKN